MLLGCGGRKRVFLVFFLLSVACAIGLAQQPLTLGARFFVAADSSMLQEDWYDIGADLNLDFEVTKRFDCALGLEADRFEVEVEELSFGWEAHPYLELLFGQFENAPTLEEYIPAHKRLFAAKSLVAEQVDTQGFISSAIGAMLFKEYDKDDLPLSYLLHASFNLGHGELQFNAGFLHHFAGKDSWLGILVSYLPFFIHALNLDDWSEQTHYALVDLIWANYERKFFYGSEISFGSNLMDPIGLTGYPPGEDHPYFLGADLHAGYAFRLGAVEWLPALRVSLLFPDLGVMQANELEMWLGNLFRFTKDILLHVDGGIAVLSRYREAELYTNLEALWAVQFMVRI